ncbi:hypothetical protein [Coraliomargarita parva]|uniref:hypothetical protein n=1 Tax=Coraliomargarita parva TaxID=3014050 RepID=UPI0022B37FD1|nr:hypothetical protein [Coraliomargarita parva]
MSAALAKNAEKEPTLIGILILGVLMALIGSLLGFLCLASFPARAFSTPAETEEFVSSKLDSYPMPGDAYYMQGPELRTNSWVSKRLQALSGDPVTLQLTAGELNAWMGARFKPGNANELEGEANILVVPGIPNFYTEGQAMYISLPSQLLFYGLDLEFTAFAKGHFTSGPSPDFIVDEFHVNSASVPVQAGLAKKLGDFLVSAYSSSEEYLSLQGVWERVESLELKDGSIRLNLR